MNARTWIPVVAVALMIAAAPLLQSLVGPPTPEMFQAARASTERAARNAALAAAVSVTIAAIEARDRLAGHEGTVAASAASVLLVAALATLAFRRQRQDDAIRRRVRHWARRGRTTAWIARKSGLAQDAVRLVVGSLTPPPAKSPDAPRRSAPRRG
ncbi:MAG: hypothetical protein AAB011_14545 [Candidatus Eisenbacteria bacterium]